jgi:hypothetical protein
MQMGMSDYTCGEAVGLRLVRSTANNAGSMIYWSVSEIKQRACRVSKNVQEGEHFGQLLVSLQNVMPAQHLLAVQTDISR